MSKGKIITITIVLLFIISLGFNYALYKEKEGYIDQIGSQYQRTVRITLSEINDGNTDYWIDTLNEDKGDVYLERHIGELKQLSREFHRMSGEMSGIGMLIDDIINHYYELEHGIKSGKNIAVQKTKIEGKNQLINSILTEIDSELGEDRMRWYKELSGSQTNIQQKVWEKLKEYEEQNT